MAVHYYTEQCDYILKGKGKTTAWIKQCVVNEGFRQGDVSYIFCNSQRHKQINIEYLGHDYYTDVITFDYGSERVSCTTGQTIRTVSGDIFIDFQTVALNAAEYGVSASQEMMRVIIHGILHLCGYKDKTPQEEKTMREKENFYLEILKNNEIWQK